MDRTICQTSPMSVKGERWGLDDKSLSMTYSSEKVLASLMRRAKQRFPVRRVLHQSRWLSYFPAPHYWLRGAMGITISHKHGGWPDGITTVGYRLNTILAAKFSWNDNWAGHLHGYNWPRWEGCGIKNIYLVSVPSSWYRPPKTLVSLWVKGW